MTWPGWARQVVMWGIVLQMDLQTLASYHSGININFQVCGGGGSMAGVGAGASAVPREGAGASAGPWQLTQRAPVSGERYARRSCPHRRCRWHSSFCGTSCTASRCLACSRSCVWSCTRSSWALETWWLQRRGRPRSRAARAGPSSSNGAHTGALTFTPRTRDGVLHSIISGRTGGVPPSCTLCGPGVPRPPPQYTVPVSRAGGRRATKMLVAGQGADRHPGRLVCISPRLSAPRSGADLWWAGVSRPRVHDRVATPQPSGQPPPASGAPGRRTRAFRTLLPVGGAQETAPT